MNLDAGSLDALNVAGMNLDGLAGGVLLADADWGKLIGFAVVIIVYAINYFLGADGRAKAKRPPTPRPQPQDRPQGIPDRGRQQTEDEVAEFLRRAADKRGTGSPASPVGRAPSERPPLSQPLSERRPVPQPSQQAAQRPLSQSPQQQAKQAARQSASRQRGGQPAVDVVPIDESGRGSSSRRKSVASTVATIAPQVATRRISSTVDQADEQMDSHLHQVFDHRLGTLSGTETPESQPSSNAASPEPIVAPIGFAALLANADNLRNAIVLNEILTRPTDRW